MCNLAHLLYQTFSIVGLEMCLPWNIALQVLIPKLAKGRTVQLNWLAEFFSMTSSVDVLEFQIKQQVLSALLVGVRIGFEKKR